MAGVAPVGIEFTVMQRISQFLTGFLTAAVVGGYATVAEAQTWEKPFAKNSIWNTKIGKNPNYVPCNLGVLAGMCNDREGLYRTKSSDPLRPVKRPDGREGNPPINFPETINFLVEPNDGKAFLLPDGITVREYVLWQQKDSLELGGWHFGDHSLTGDGIIGGHGAVRDVGAGRFPANWRTGIEAAHRSYAENGVGLGRSVP